MLENGPRLTSIKIFLIFLRLGCTSFGGPVAHLGYFHHEFVVKRRWVTEAGYAELLALCHFLPGPSSSQVGMALGALQSGWRGALAAWLGFTLPSAVFLIALALGLAAFSDALPAAILDGLKIAAIAIVAHATYELAMKLCPDKPTRLLAVAAAVFLIMVPSIFSQVIVIAMAAIIGRYGFKASSPRVQIDPATIDSSSKQVGSRYLWLGLYGVVLFLLFFAEGFLGDSIATLAKGFYITGSLVFGGGHVVLPMLQELVVATGLMEPSTFLAGYGLTQAIPGPLFTFAAFLGASVSAEAPIFTAVICLIAIFAPGYFLLLGVLPFWAKVRKSASVISAMRGVNAAVVGLLLAACLEMSQVLEWQSFASIAVFLLVLVLLFLRRLPAWALVFGAAIIHYGLMLLVSA